MDFLDFSNFFFRLPIYTPVSVPTKQDLYKIIRAAYSDSDAVFEGYNPIRKSESSFRVTSFDSPYQGPEYMKIGGVARLVIRCKRWDDYMYFFIRYTVDDEKVIKIGQYPSIADFQIHEIKKYTKVLSKEKLREFTRAIGLAANGVGIGSFVYLRRIFESLIEEAHTIAKKDSGWNEEAFLRARMADKIQILETHLPPFLVANKSLYGILSVGVHALNEEDCLAHFDTVRVGIELILDEKLEAFERKRKIEEAQQKLAALTNKVKGQQ
jgi:hypothetical protein